MENKEKIIKVYQKYGISINENYLEGILKNKKRVKQFIRIYKNEEIESLNYIFGKKENNYYFTKIELEVSSGLDLFDGNVLKMARKIWTKRSNKKWLKLILKALNDNNIKAFNQNFNLLLNMD